MEVEMNFEIFFDRYQQHFTDACKHTHPDAKGLGPVFTLYGCEASLSLP